MDTLIVSHTTIVDMGIVPNGSNEFTFTPADDEERMIVG